MNNLAKDFLSGAIGAAAALTLQAADPVYDAADHDLAAEGDLAISLASARTNYVTGVISGAGKVSLNGHSSGVAVLSNAANSYTGGTVVQNGQLYLAANGAAGTGTISAEHQNARVVVSTPELTNDVVWTVNSGVYDNYWFAGFYVRDNADIRGNITSAGDLSIGSRVFGVGTEWTSPPDTSLTAGPYVTYHGDVTLASGRSLRVFAVGTNDFRGKVTARYLENNFSGSYRGVLRFSHSGNEIERIRFIYSSIFLAAEDALPGALIHFLSGLNGNYDTRARVVLENGCTQSIGGLSMGTDVTCSTYTHGVVVKAEEGKPAVLRVTGTTMAAAGTLSHKVALEGPLTYVHDASTTDFPDFYEDFTNRYSSMSGDIIVSNGEMRVSGWSKFENVPRIYVGANGRLVLNANSGANTQKATPEELGATTFAACTKLEVYGQVTIGAGAGPQFTAGAVDLVLGPDAELTLPESAVLEVRSVALDDGSGNLTPCGQGLQHLDQIRGGQVMATISAATPATWTGAGENDAVSTAANWKNGVTPALRSYSVLATFAESGAAATANGDLALYGLVFAPVAGTDGFTLAAATGTEKISLYDDGLAFTAANDGRPRTYRLGPRVEFASASVGEIVTPAADTAVFERGFAASTGMKIGGGTNVLFGITTLGGTLVITNSSVLIAGTIATDQPNGNAVGIRALKGDVPSLPSGAYLTLSNAVINGGMDYWGSGNDNGGCFDRSKVLVAAAGTENTLDGRISVGRNSTIRLEEGASLTVTGGGSFYGAKTTVEGSGTLVFGPGSTLGGLKSNSTTEGNGIVANGSSTVRIESSGNGEANETAVSTLSAASSGTLEFAANECFTNGRGRVWFYSGDITAKLDVLGTRQTLREIAENGNNQQTRCQITGGFGSLLRLKKGRTTQKWSGGVSMAKVEMEGDVTGGTLVYSNNTATTCGDVSVSAGTLRFGPNAYWPVGTNVTVSGTGTLALSQNDHFARHAVFTIADSGVVDLDYTGVQRVSALRIDGRLQPSGTWGAIGSGARNKSARLTGTGMLLVPGGTCLFFR